PRSLGGDRPPLRPRGRAAWRVLPRSRGAPQARALLGDDGGGGRGAGATTGRRRAVARHRRGGGASHLPPPPRAARRHRSRGVMQAWLARDLKLGAGPRFRLPHRAGEPMAPRRLWNVSLDTADHRLAMAGVTLRRRIEGRKSLWQLKLPRGNARLEL